MNERPFIIDKLLSKILLNGTQHERWGVTALANMNILWCANNLQDVFSDSFRSHHHQAYFVLFNKDEESFSNNDF